MSNWKFTDQYSKSYPALANSILSQLIFDVPEGTSPVDGTAFSAPLDLTASGMVMKVLATITGLNTIPMTGTVTTDNNTLTIKLVSSDDAAITAAIAKSIPLIGGQITQKAWVSIDNQTAASATADDNPIEDEIDLNVTIAIGQGTGTLSTQVPMSAGICVLRATFQGFGVQLSDLNFLVDGSSFSTMFPTTLPSSYYDAGTTALELLSLDLWLLIDTSGTLSISVPNVTVTIGIVNIPLKPNALFLNPLSVWVTVTDPTGSPNATWGLTGVIALYPQGQQTNPPAANPDFTFEFQMDMPTKSNPTFGVSGNFDNPDSLSVATLLCDLLDDGTFNTGIGANITIDKFDFNTVADTSNGTISDFSVDVAMSSPIGLFATPDFGVKDFSISLAYES